MKRLFQMLFFVLFIGVYSASALDVVPGQKGFGTHTRAAYGNNKNPTIFVVNTLSNAKGTLKNTTRNGIPVKTGSFKDAINYNVNNKLIIFEVSGTITLQQTLYLDNNYVTIAGQTAPSPGITLRGLKLVISGHDILMQHLRVRVGDDTNGVPYDHRDGINVTAASGVAPYNVVVDHCSISWAIDENVGIGGLNSHDITFSNCIISEGLSNSLHSKGEHSKGMIIGDVTKLSLIRNFFVHNAMRNPEIYGGTQIAMVDNYIYNPGVYNCYIIGKTGDVKMAYVGNVIEGGKNSQLRAREKTPRFWESTITSKYYLHDNKTDAGRGDWELIRDDTGINVKLKCKVLNPPLWPNGLVSKGSTKVKSYVLNNAGARPYDRDRVASRLVNDAINGSGTLKDCVSGCARSAGGYPYLAKKIRTPSLPSNPHSDSDGDGYTNLEEWLHGLAKQVEKPSTALNPQPPTDLIFTKP